MSTFGGRHIMVDLETLGTAKDTVVTQIGAVAFYPKTGEVSRSERFIMHLDMAQQMGAGRSVDPSTLLWWMGQDDAARATFRKGQASAGPLVEGLLAFTEFIERPNGRRGLGTRPEKPAGVWSNGASFDCAILEQAYGAAGLVGFDYRRVRDTRTLWAMDPDKEAGWGSPEPQVAHSAIDDAVAQAYGVINTLHRLGLGPPVLVLEGEPT